MHLLNARVLYVIFGLLLNATAGATIPFLYASDNLEGQLSCANGDRHQLFVFLVVFTREWYDTYPALITVYLILL